MLSNSGHIAAMVNPPSNPKATFRLAPSNPPDHREWLAQAETVQGSWWPDYTTWLVGAERRDEASPADTGQHSIPAAVPRTRHLHPAAVRTLAGHYPSRNWTPNPPRG